MARIVIGTVQSNLRAADKWAAGNKFVADALPVVTNPSGRDLGPWQAGNRGNEAPGRARYYPSGRLALEVYPNDVGTFATNVYSEAGETLFTQPTGPTSLGEALRLAEWNYDLRAGQGLTLAPAPKALPDGAGAAVAKHVVPAAVGVAVGIAVASRAGMKSWQGAAVGGLAGVLLGIVAAR